MPPDSAPRRVIIVDDEPVARRRLRRFLQNQSSVLIVDECSDGAAALAAIRQHRPDIVFLDVQMPEMNGFEVLRTLGPGSLPVIIFVTAFDQFALQAFEAQAVDYLLKPFGEERVRQALERARTFLEGGAKRDFQAQLAALLQATALKPTSAPLLVKGVERVILLRPKEITWVEADGDYVRLHVGPASHLHRATLAEMERTLSAEGFVRIHRSRLVNLDCLREIRPVTHGESIVVLLDGTRLVASQTCLRKLQERWTAAEKT